ncbi:MAG: hypothetical protein PHT33_04610 [bacterium]|nr:hypothetical protein [bacterium]
MKRIVLAIALVALFAVPAVAQNVNVNVDGLLVGAFTDLSGEDSSFSTFSVLDWDYSNIALSASVGDKVAVTYRLGLDDFVAGETPYTREAYVSLLNVAPAISAIKVGEFTFPFGAQEWFGYYKSDVTYITATGTGVGIDGSFAPIDYKLAVMNPTDLNGNDSYAQGTDKPIWAKVSTDLGVVNAGVSYVKQGDSNSLGVDAAFDAGIVGVKAEYITTNNFFGDDLKLIFAGATVPVSGPLSVFAKYYNVSGDITGDALAFGADYAITSNAVLRIEHINDDNDIWAPTGTEAQLRVSF